MSKDSNSHSKNQPTLLKIWKIIKEIFDLSDGIQSVRGIYVLLITNGIQWVGLTNEKINVMLKNISIFIDSHFWQVAFWIFFVICLKRDIAQFLKKRAHKKKFTVDQFLSQIELLVSIAKKEGDFESENKAYEELIEITPEKYREFLPKEQMITHQQKEPYIALEDEVYNVSKIRSRRIIKIKFVAEQLGCYDKALKILDT